MMNVSFGIDGRILETERLILRPFRDEDIDDFYAYASILGVRKSRMASSPGQGGKPEDSHILHE